MKYSTAFPFFPAKDIDEILKQFRDILEGREMLTMDKNVAAFEKEFGQFVEAKYAVAMSSCTSGLETCLRALNIGQQDEVIVPVQTFIATGSCVVRNGSRVIFCETDDNFLIDFNDMKKKITARTKAVIMVHFAGLIHPQIDEIYQYLKQNHIYLIEDAAHAHGAKAGRLFAGNLADMACFSFFSTKNMTTGEGGMITTNNERLYQLCNSMRNRGADVWNDPNVFSEVGSNYRITEFQAILGRYQLKRIEEFVYRRNSVAETYRSALFPLVEERKIRFQTIPAGFRHAYWRFSVFVQNERIDLHQLQERLAIRGIPIDFPYTPLLHLQPIFQKLYGIKHGSFPKTEQLATRHFCLPMHPLLTNDDAGEIAEILKQELQ